MATTEDRVGGREQAPPGGPHAVPGLALAAAPAALTLVLLFVAAWTNGAFALRSWAPLALFALVGLAFGRRNGVRGAAVAAAAAMFAFAAWTLLSVLWADAPGRAVEGAGRTMLYAALVAVPLLTLPTRATARAAARAVTAGLGLVVLASLLGCLVEGDEWFLAGRLDDPVAYRNGTAALFAMAFWPLLCTAARRSMHPLVRAAAFSLAVAALGLAFLTQSRGVLLGLGCGALVALVLGPDRVRRAWLTIAAAGAVAIVSAPLLRPWDAFLAANATDTGAVDEAITALALLTAAAFVAALLGALFDGGLRMSEASARGLRTAAAAALVVVAVGGAGAGLVAVGDPIAFAGDKLDEFKQVETTAEPGATRLGSTGGQRYDLWRIAWREFESAPLTGVGEGGYPARYYRERATDRNLSTPHSEPLRVLAETGLVGALLLAAALVAVGVAIARPWGRTDADSRRWASGLASGAVVVIGQSSVDWFWLIPGLMGLAVFGLATAAAGVAVPEAPDPGAGAGAPGRPRSRPAVWTAARVIPALAAVVVGLLYLSDVHTRTARASGPEERLSAARTAERLNPFALAPRYLQAGALEQLRRRAEARRELLGALDVEPDSFVTLGLLGDLETRAGRRGAARAYYRRALALNPRDVGLQELAR